MLVGWAAKTFGSWSLDGESSWYGTLLFFTVWCGLSALFANSPEVSWVFIVNFLKIVAPSWWP